MIIFTFRKIKFDYKKKIKKIFNFVFTVGGIIFKCEIDKFKLFFLLLFICLELRGQYYNYLLFASSR